MVFLRSKIEKPVSGELSAAAEAASVESESTPHDPAPGMTTSADSSAKPAADHASQAPQKLSEEARQKLAENETQFALNFVRVVSVLARSPRYKHYALTDLEWLVIPPLRTGQCAILNAETPGLPVAAALALWASVSSEVDQRLSQNLHAPIRLRPDEWLSGEILWLIDVVGDAEAVQQLMEHLKNDRFKDRQVKVRHMNVGGQIAVINLFQQ